MKPRLRRAFDVVVVVLSLGDLWVGAACAPTRPAATPGTRAYLPSGDAWIVADPAQVGMDPALLSAALAYGQAHETTRPRDFSDQARIFGRQLGPLPSSRNATNAVVVRRGYIVGSFGDTARAEPTYSVAKSLLATVAGIAVDRGLIPDVGAPVGRTVHDGGYDSPRNAQVTWLQHLQQTSEWEGEMWGKRHDFVGAAEFGEGARPPRALQAPGTYWEYNDVRINRLALSLLRVFGRPLPEIARQSVFDPIGVSRQCEWAPYTNASVEVNGRGMPSVSGGTRWGGGLWISTQDEARLGLLWLHRGRSGSRTIVSDSWMRLALTPSRLKPEYGALFWLNTGRTLWPSLSERSFAAIGFGSNTIWVDPDLDLLVVWRWHDGTGEPFFARVAAAVTDTASRRDHFRGVLDAARAGTRIESGWDSGR